MPTPKKHFKTVDEYIKTFPADVQRILEQLRQTIRKAAPEAEETISYQIPAFAFKAMTVVYFAGFKKHIGLYPPAPRVFKKEVAAYAGPKGNLQFPLDTPMPLDLVKRIVAHRMKEVLKSEEKSHKRPARENPRPADVSRTSRSRR